MDDIRRIAGKKFDASKINLLMNELYPGKNRDVPDPYYGPESGYIKTYDLIEKACEAIVKKYLTLNPDSYRDQFSILK